jgi:hypothetical protein
MSDGARCERAERAEAERDAWIEATGDLTARLGAVAALVEYPPPLYWLEGVPSGSKWYCGDCSAVVGGFSELEQAEADAAMPHLEECRWVFAKRIRAALVEAAA